MTHTCIAMDREAFNGLKSKHSSADNLMTRLYLPSRCSTADWGIEFQKIWSFDWWRADKQQCLLRYFDTLSEFILQNFCWRFISVVILALMFAYSFIVCTYMSASCDSISGNLWNAWINCKLKITFIQYQNIWMSNVSLEKSIKLKKSLKHNTFVCTSLISASTPARLWMLRGKFMLFSMEKVRIIEKLGL